MTLLLMNLFALHEIVFEGQKFAQYSNFMQLSSKEKSHKEGVETALKDRAGVSSCPQDKGVQVHWVFIVAISFFCCNTGDEILGLWMLCKLLPQFLVS